MRIRLVYIFAIAVGIDGGMLRRILHEVIGPKLL
jgi:hypothetical protein